MSDQTAPKHQPQFAAAGALTGAALLLLLALGIWLRWQFIRQVHLYPDEFVTLLAVRMIGQHGWPLMPSGLFYEHGLLFSYAGALAAWLGQLHPTVRYASLLFGGLTLLLIFWVGRRWYSPAVGLLAVAGLVIAPAAIQWSGRARMYALLQLLVLLTLWLAYEGVTKNRPSLRWLALLAYLGATLTHFVAVALAPPLLLALLLVTLAGRSRDEWPSLRGWRSWLTGGLAAQGVALGGILLLAFWVKRAGQPKGIEALDSTPSAALSGLAEVLTIYSDLSLNLPAGWQAIAPFYEQLPALLFVPFGLLAGGAALWGWLKTGAKSPLPTPQRPALYLATLLLLTTLEMMLLVSPDRRDDKYLFMLLPALLLLGAGGLGWLGEIGWRRLRSAAPPPLLLVGAAVAVSGLIVAWGWPAAQALLQNRGDDYDAAFAYVQAHWQPGDTILSGTPAAAAFYLGHNDFYSVQRRGGYDYRILTVDGQAVDRWLASPAIRTLPTLHQTLAQHNVWLVLERWGLQREYYDLPFQQQLLAQTEHVSDAQGIFILRSKNNPRPLSPTPAQPLDATFNQVVRLLGYTAEPAQGQAGQPLRLTLYWQALAPLPHNYTVFVHLRRPDGGGNVAQADHRPLGSLYPTSLWPVGEIIRESSELYLPPDIPAGDYELWAGLYRLESGRRLPVDNDASGENAVKLGILIIN